MTSLGLQQFLQHTRRMRHGMQALHLRRRNGDHTHTLNHSLKSIGEHLVRTLVSTGHLPSQSTKSVTLNVWSDYSGINSAMFALQALSDNIKEIVGGNVEWNLYYTCDSDPRKHCVHKT